MAQQLFGFSLQRAKKVPKGPSFVQKDSLDGSQPIVGGGYFGYSVDFDGTIRNDHELITRYREMVLNPECDSAVDDVVNETICGNFDDVPISIDLHNLKQSEKIKKLIRSEFDEILRLLDFDNRAYEIFRRWYVDGRLFFHKVIDPKKPRNGLIELRYVDPRKIRKVTEYEAKRPEALRTQDLNQQLTQQSASYFLYNPKGLKNSTNQGMKIAPDSIAYCHSGIQDLNKNMVLSHLHKAIKAVNQLRMIEDSLVIYRLSRAPERRIFYIDVGNLPKIKAEQYLRDVMNRYRNKLVYNADTGEIRDDRKYMAMLEDFWLPRREGGRGTEITTLPGGQNLGELSDIEYFQSKLYKSLNVPSSRLDSQGGFNLGRSSEILRDELKFTKFVGRLRKRFSQVFMDMLKTQLILKNIITVDDWEELSDHIQFDFLYDNHFSDLKANELLQEQLGVVASMEPYMGKYFSAHYVRTKVLKQTEDDIKDLDREMEEEIEAGIIPDPNMPLDPSSGMPVDQIADPTQNPNSDMSMGKPVNEPDLDSSTNKATDLGSSKATEIKMPKGGEI